MKRPWRKRLVRAALAALLLLAGLLGVALGLLLYHPAGLPWAFAQLGSLSAPKIQAEVLEGRLAGPLTIRGLQVDGEGYRLRLDTLSLDWRPAALWRGEFHLRKLAVAGGRLQLIAGERSAASSGSASFEGVALPLALRLDELELSSLLIEPPDDAPQRIEHLSMSAHGRGSGIALQRLELQMPQLALQARGEVGLAASLPLELNLSWQTRPPQRPPLRGEGRIAGNLQRLQLNQTISGGLTGRLDASLSELRENPRWDARLSLQESELSAWLGGLPLGLSGELSSRGSLEHIALQADLKLRQAEYGATGLMLQGTYTGGRFEADRLTLETPAGGHLEAHGHYTPDEDLGRFQAELSWRDLRWPLQGESPQLLSPQGAMQLAGTPTAYDFSLKAGLQLAGQPAAAVEARGKGDLQGIALEELTADFVPGRLRAEGAVAWQPALSWRLVLAGEDIDPARWHADFPGRLRLDAESEGRLEADGIHAAFRLDRLTGRLRDYPFTAQGKARLAGSALELDELQIRAAANRVTLAGRAAERLDLSWRIEAPELAALWPGLGGRLNGRGRLDGPLDAPGIAATLDAEELSFAGHGANTLHMNADASLAGERPLSLKLRSSGLRLAGGNWKQLDLQASGTLAAHRLRLALDGAGPGLRLQADAGWSDEKQWRGELKNLQLSLPEQPSWRLTDGGGFVLGRDRQRLERLCLASGEAGFCGAFSHAPQTGWDANLQARHFPLALLSPWLPEGLQLDGQGELQAQLAVDGGGRSQGAWRLQLPRGRIGLDLEHEAERIDFAGGELRGRLDGEGADLNLELPLAGLGEVAGQLQLPGFDPLALRPDTQPLQGRLRLDLNDLSRLAQLSPRLRNPRGRITGDFTLAGTLRQPRLLGSAELRQGAMDIPELGLELRGIDLQLTTPSAEKLALTGALQSGNGRLALSGALALDAQAGFPASLHLAGKELTVANLPQAQVEITPDLTLERDRQGTRLQGRIEIPYARLRPRTLPTTAVSASPDLVVVGADEASQRPFDPRLSAELRVVLGDRVSFDGFGLRGKLVGSLLVIDEPKRPVIGRGRVGISEGTYRAYGQDLTIERGFALFVDSPVDNPGLDVRALREIDEVRAGIRVSGTLKEPKIDLFSSPAMGDDDILSYLLTGRPAGAGGGQSVGIAAALKATGAGTVAEELGRQFGLEELRLDAGNGLQEASVVAGTYLSPRLYIQYINELASRETKLRLRYDINKRLQLEAETGKTQAGDLYYTFDR